MKGNDLFYRYYDALFKKKDYLAETELVFLLSKKFDIGVPKKILEIGCGTGNHTTFLASKGIELVAIDIDPKMLDIARRKLKRFPGNRFRILHTTVEKLEERNFDLAMAFFNVVTYIPDTDKLNSFMKGVASCLVPGGIFVFDCWNGIAAILNPPGSKITSVKHQGKKVDCLLTSKTNLFNQITTLNYKITVSGGKTLGKGDFSFTQTLWTPMQIQSAIKAAGMEVLLCSPLMKPDEPATYKDWKIMFCCRKPK